MKRFLVELLALFAVAGASAQQPAAEEYSAKVDTLRQAQRFDSFRMHDSGRLDWQSDNLRLPTASLRVVPLYEDWQNFGGRSVFPTTSVLEGFKALPAHIVVFDEQTLMRFGRGSVSITNGQAQNFPGGHLDARTLSFPAPR